MLIKSENRLMFLKNQSFEVSEKSERLTIHLSSVSKHYTSIPTTILN
jgi:hypothetical protein